MRIFKNTASEGQFILKDIVYNVTGASLSAYYQDMELVLFPEVEAKTEEGHVEYEMRGVRLYHNNGFNTHISNFDGLKGRKFVWPEEYNTSGEKAGTLYVQEHEAVRKGTIEIMDVGAAQMTVRWSGQADVGWSRKYGSKVPFETVFQVGIPDTVNYCLDAFKSTVMRIDEETRLELLNLEEFNQEIERVSKTRDWEDFNTVLKFRFIHRDTEYLGEVRFLNGKNNFELTMDKGCPRKINFKNVDFNLRVNYEMFIFEIM